MKVAELIAILQTLPQDAPVFRSDGSGCHHCNENGIDYYTEVSDPTFSDGAPVNGYHRPFIPAVIL